jgi:large subunit ribosomal protein L10
MAISKDKKKELLEQYVDDLKNAGSAYVINQNAIPVNIATTLRKEIKANGGKVNVVRKRIFLKAIQKAGFQDIDLQNLEGAALTIYAPAEDYTPLKTIVKYNKEFKALDKKSAFGFLGGWINKSWNDAVYITELANIPSKEELLSKLLYLLNYPVQSLACVLDQIAKKSS